MSIGMNWTEVKEKYGRDARSQLGDKATAEVYTITNIYIYIYIY
jgi:hypothetical protein